MVPKKRQLPAREGKQAGPSAISEAGIGDTLRRIYDDTVDEQVPAELIDLLNKLS